MDWDKHALTYDSHWNSSRQLKRVEMITSFVRPGDKVLELGCGTGQLTEKLVGAGATVTALDCSQGMIDIAKAKGIQARFIQCDLNGEWPVLGDYDIVCGLWILMYVKDLERVVDRIADLIPKTVVFIEPDASHWFTFLRVVSPLRHLLQVPKEARAYHRRELEEAFSRRGYKCNSVGCGSGFRMVGT